MSKRVGRLLVQEHSTHEPPYLSPPQHNMARCPDSRFKKTLYSVNKEEKDIHLSVEQG